MAPQPTAPPVVAVVVTCDPGPWFDEALSSLADQDYPNLSVLVIDSGSAEDPTPRVAANLPGAYLTRLGRRMGFGAAANEVFQAVDGASHYLFCHDDVAFAPDAVRQLLEEAFRSNAGVATPKLVEWERPDRLLAVGASVDRVGAHAPLVDPGELDQAQHDAVRDVFVAPSAATLVRADLFGAIGGYSHDVEQFGEDLDLSWRAQLAGARVVAVPAARVRHRVSLQRGERAGWTDAGAPARAQTRTDTHRVRTLLACVGILRLPWVLTVAAVFAGGEALTRLVQGRPAEAARVVKAFAAGFAHLGRLVAARRVAQHHRRVHDGAIRRLQTRGNARLRAFLRARFDGGDSGIPSFAFNDDEPDLPVRASRGARDRGTAMATPPVGDGALAPGSVALAQPAPAAVSTAPTVGRGTWRLPVITALVVTLLVVIGSRNLFSHDLPGVGQIPSTAGGLGGWWRSWWSTWRPQGLGSIGASPPALGLLVLGGTVLFGAVGVLQHVVVLLPLLLGPFGAYRAARPWASPRAKAATAIVYATVPLAYNAMAHGHWAALLAYAAASWVLALLGRTSGTQPFPATRPAQVVGRTVGLGVLVAVVASVGPAFVLVLPVIGVGLLAGSAVAGQVAAGVRMLAVSVGAALVAFVLLLPWAFGVFGSRVALFGVTSGGADRLGLGQILRFHTGPIGGVALGWGLLAVAALPLIIGRSWRLAWAGRLWMVALLCFGWAWAGSRGWVPVPQLELVLAPAAAALAGSAGLGAVAFDLDLPGYRFGWRQLVSGLALIGALLAAVPAVVAASDGHWHLPSQDATVALPFLDRAPGGDYRVLWVGAPGALPMHAQYLEDGIGYGTTYNGAAEAADVLPNPIGGATGLLAVDLQGVQQRLTTGVGHLLAPMAVRYIVVPNHDGPAGSGAAAVRVPSDLLAGLQAQTDLQLTASDADYTVYVNSAWMPARALLSPSASATAVVASGLAGDRTLEATDLAGAPAVLRGGPASGHGPLPAGSAVYVSASRNGNWQLHVLGATATRLPAFGWAQQFRVPPGGGAATLTTTAGGAERAGLIVELVLWAAALGWVIVDLRRRRAGAWGPEAVRPEWFLPALRPRAPVSRPSGRTVIGVGDEGMDSEEMWIDA